MTDTLPQSAGTIVHEGMFWHSDADEPLEDRIMDAVRFYRDKYGEPNAVIMHPDAGDVELDGIEVQTAVGILPDHFWIGKVKER